jgi:hypothetical protein
VNPGAGLNPVSKRENIFAHHGNCPGINVRARSVVIVPTALPGALYSLTKLQFVLWIIHLAMVVIRSFHRSVTANRMTVAEF